MRLGMVSWFLLGIVACATVALWRYLGSQSLGRKQRREDLAHFVRSLLILMMNGGRLQARQRDGPVAFTLVRAEGGGGAAKVTLQIPRDTWSKVNESTLLEAAAAHGLELTPGHERSPDSLLEIRFLVDDIWVEWSGAGVARGAHVLLEALGVPEDALFDFSLHGGRSLRFVKWGQKVC